MVLEVIVTLSTASSFGFLYNNLMMRCKCINALDQGLSKEEVENAAKYYGSLSPIHYAVYVTGALGRRAAYMRQEAIKNWEKEQGEIFNYSI